MDELNNNQGNENIQNTQDNFNTPIVYRPTDDGWGSLPQTADVFGVVGLSQEQVAVKSYVDEQIRKREEELNINCARRDLYAMTMGKEKAGAKEAELQKQIDEKKKTYGDSWNDRLTEGFRSNFWKDQYNSLQQYYGYGRHVDVNLTTLRNLALNKNLNNPDTLSYLGIAQEVKDNNDISTFSRSWALSSLQNEVKQSYFENSPNSKEEFENTQQSLATAQYLYSNDDDSSLLSFAGQTGDMLLGAVDRTWGGWGWGLASLAGATALAPLTGGTSLKAWGTYTFAKDMFDTTRSDIAFNAKTLDPTLTDYEAFNSPTNILTSLGLSALNTVGVGYMAKVSVGAINKILNTGKMLDKTLVTGLDSASVKLARNKAVLTELQNSVKELGVSTGVNAGVGGATAFTQQLVTNIVGNQKDILEGTGSALVDGAGTGAVMGALPLPIEMARLGYVYRTQTKAMNSALEALNKKSKDAVLHNTDAYKQNSTETAEALQQQQGFNEDKVFMNIRDMEAWSKDKNIDIRKSEWAKKIKEAEDNGRDEVSLNLKEQAQLKNGRWQEMINDVGRTAIDDMPPTEIREYLSDEEIARAKEIAQKVKENQSAIEKEREETSKIIATDLYSEMEKTELEPQQKDALVGMNISMFQSISQNYSIPMRELWDALRGHWQPFDKILTNNVNNLHNKPKHARGNYAPEQGTIRLAGGADMATATHEFAHYTLDTLIKLATSRRKQGKQLKKLEDSLTAVLSEDWIKRAKDKTEIEKMQEEFAFQFLDYVMGTPKKEAGTELLNSVKKMIVSAERRRYKITDEELDNYGGAQGVNRSEFKARFGYALPERSSAFDTMANALFKADEVMRRLEDDYSTESIVNLMPDAVLAEKKRLHPDETSNIESVNREIADAREQAETAMSAQMIKQSGYLFSFNDGFLRRWKELSENKEELKKIIEESKDAKDIFRKAREKAKADFDNTVMGKLYEQISTYKVNDGKTIRELKKEGLLTQAQYKALKERGIIVESGGRNPEDFYGRQEGITSREIVRDKRFSQMLEMMLEMPTKDEVIYHMSLDAVSKSIKAKQDIVANSANMRALLTKTREKIATANAKILQSFTKTPMDKEGVIKYVASTLLRKTRLSDLREGDTMRRAKNARRELERAVVKGDFERAGAESRAERIHIRMANLIVKEGIYLKKEITKHNRILRSDKWSAKNNYDNEILDLARFIGNKKNIYRDTKKVTLEKLQEYAERNPVVKDLLEKYKDQLSVDGSGWLNRTVDETHAILDMLRDIEVQAKNYRTTILDGRLVDAKELAEKVADIIQYKKYATDGNGHKAGDIVIGDNGEKIAVKVSKDYLQDKEGNATAVPTTFKGKINVLGQIVRGAFGRTLSWCGTMDGVDGGLCSRLLYHPIARATASAKHAQNETIKKINGITNGVKWKAGEIVATELTDRVTGAPLKFGSAKGIYGNGSFHLFGFLMHMGNEENWRKLLLSQGWTEEQVMGFINRMIKEGYITKESLLALNKVWNMFDIEFEKANRAYYEMHGRYVKKVEARPIDFTMPDGERIHLKGGYAPLISDKYRNPERLGDPLALDALTPDKVEGNLFKQQTPASSTDFMTERTDKLYYLDFNPTTLLAVAPRVSAYAELVPAVTRTYNFWRRPEIQRAIGKVDPKAYSQIIKPFITKALQRSVEQSGDIIGNKLAGKITNKVGVNVMCLYLTNAITQFGGLFNAMLFVKPHYLFESMGSALFDFHRAKNEVVGRSVIMRDRIDESASHLVETVNQITVNAESEGAWNKTKALTSKSSILQNKMAYIFQKTVQDRIDVAIHQGVFKQELKKLGKDIKDLTPEEYDELVRKADEAVIKSQSSSSLIDKSNIETGSALLKLLFQFHNYFITVNALTFERLGRLTRSDANTMEKVKVLSSLLIFNYLLPAYFAEAVSMTGRGDWWNDDLDDTENLLHLTISAPIAQLTSAVPFAGDVIKGAVDHLIEKDPSNNILNIPAVSYMTSIYNGIANTLLNGKLDYRLGTATANAVGMILGMPYVAFGGQRLANVVGIMSGQIQPDNWMAGIRATLSTPRSDEKNLK